MRKIILIRRVHESWIVAAFCFGIILGILLAMGFSWNFFSSGWWILFAFILLIVAFWKPNYAFIIVAFLAGMIIGFVRSAKSLDDSSINNSNEDVWWWTHNAQTWFFEQISKAIPSPEAELASSYLLGLKNNLPNDLYDKIKTVGLAHIVVASGAHLSILVGGVKKVFSKISRFFGSVLSLIFIIIFMAMIGWTPSILRAGIMSSLIIIFGYYGREFRAWRIITFAITITLLIDPTFIADLGWILSFSSYAGIMILGPILKDFLFGKTEINFLSNLILTTVSATLATLPISLCYFGSFSLILIFANVIILPTLPYAMGLTFLTGLFSWIPFVGDILIWATTKLLDFHILIIDFFAEQKYLIVEIPQKCALVFLLYVPILIFLIFWATKSHQRRGHPKKFLPGTDHNL